MEMIVQNQSIYFYGKIKDLPGILTGYPPELTLLEFIRLKLN